MKRFIWSYSIIVFLLIVVSVVANLNNSILIAPTSYERFDQMLRQHDVDKVVTYKSGDLLIAKVFLKRSSLGKPEYRDAQGHGENTPQYLFTAATYDGLITAINDAETAAHFNHADKILVSIEPSHESLLSNWFIQCVIMLILLSVPVLCGNVGYNEGKKRTIGSIAGLVLGIFFGPFGLIVVYLSEKKPSQKSGV